MRPFIMVYCVSVLQTGAKYVKLVLPHMPLGSVPRLTLTSLHNKRRTTQRESGRVRGREGEVEYAPAATDNSQAKLINGARYLNPPKGKSKKS